MMLGRGERDGKTILILGLSLENVRRLVSNRPMLLRRETHGDGVPEGWEILILYGDTEGAIEQRLIAAGCLSADVTRTVDPCLNS